MALKSCPKSNKSPNLVTLQGRYIGISEGSVYLLPENTQLLRKGKYDCAADLMFDWFGFSCVIVLKQSTDLLVWPNQNQSNRRSVVQ